MQQELKLWDYISSSDFEVPCSPATEAAQGYGSRIWRWLTQNVLMQAKQDSSSASAECQLPSADELETMPLQPNWSEAAQALEAHLSGWFDISEPDYSGVRVLVGPPGGVVSNVLHALAEEKKLKTHFAPRSAAILEDCRSEEATSQVVGGSEDEIAVIPQLERFYLRHEDGLTLVRNLAERLMARRNVLVGCHSWAWAFLQHAIGIEDLLGTPMTLAPFDAPRLDAWFRTNYDLRESEFRQSDGEPVFPPHRDHSGSNEEHSQPEISVLIRSLAAKARGNLAVARALWRFSLRIGDLESGESAPTKQAARASYWVVSPSELELPRLSPSMGRLHRFILHALLLHAGLSLSTLIKLLPFSRDDVCRRVSELRTAGIVQEQDDTLRVALTAYPEVRQDLISEGFLADAF